MSALKKLKTCFLFLNLFTFFVLKRSFIKVLHDIAHKYTGKVTLTELREIEKLKFKYLKSQQDVTFLQNCENFGFSQDLYLSTYLKFHQEMSVLSENAY